MKKCRLKRIRSTTASKIQNVDTGKSKKGIDPKRIFGLVLKVKDFARKYLAESIGKSSEISCFNSCNQKLNSHK